LYGAMCRNYICELQQGEENMPRTKEFKSVLSLLQYSKSSRHLSPCFFLQESTSFLSTSCKERTKDIKHAFSFYLSIEAPFLRWLLTKKCTSLSLEKFLR
jgi:hypothetical protein